MSENIKSGAAIEAFLQLEAVQKEINEIYSKMIVNNNKMIGYISWDWGDEVTKKIDLSDIIKEKALSPRQEIPHTHMWVTYTGLNEIYDFCSWCDIKKEK